MLYMYDARHDPVDLIDHLPCNLPTKCKYILTLLTYPMRVATCSSATLVTTYKITWFHHPHDCNVTTSKENERNN